MSGVKEGPSIAAMKREREAWERVEALIAAGYHFELGSTITGLWYAAFATESEWEKYEEMEMDWADMYYKNAPTRTEAITLAADAADNRKEG